MTRDLLVEIGTEELPPKALESLGKSLGEHFGLGLEKLGLSFKSIRSFAAPRRLALLVSALAESQEDKVIQKRGPAISSAYNSEGLPTQALLGFVRSCNTNLSKLERLVTDKGEFIAFSQQISGKLTQDLIPDLLTEALDKLPIPKRMRWGNLDTEFVRPIHWIVLLFGDKPIKATVYSVLCGRKTYGHRFHHPAPIVVDFPKNYEKLLLSSGNVIADFDKRRQKIRASVESTAKKAGGRAVIDENLLSEVTGMVEWPQPILGSFDPEYLQIPADALISAMKNHQKYFHILNDQGHLLPKFIAICNIESKDPAQVRAGNERVIRPRLADARFFWEKDAEVSLYTRVESLKTILFQKQLGTLFDKVTRLRTLAKHIGRQLGAEDDLIDRAAELCKSDLTSLMVNEFPELQGIMGGHYARQQQEAEAVALAIEQHYRPRFSGDVLPDHKVALALALADKIDTLVGIFGIGLQPTGDKDPYGLRRAALGCIRILVESKVSLDLRECISHSIEFYCDTNLHAETLSKVEDFILGRLQPYFSARGFALDLIDAVLAIRPIRYNELDARLNALLEFRNMPECPGLTEANKRIANILKQTKHKIADQFDQDTLVEPAEILLAKCADESRQTLADLLARGDFLGAMRILTGMREPLDRFFAEVLVMAEDPRLSQNRLSLLKYLRSQFLLVADISKLQH